MSILNSENRPWLFKRCMKSAKTICAIQWIVQIYIFIISILKSLMIPAIGLALSNVINSQITLFFAINHICCKWHHSCSKSQHFCFKSHDFCFRFSTIPLLDQ